ncbi:hypothetical protein [Desulfoscipio geothermicus]|uniref:Uncharacterized protein n=1 Tax=Desulfoscipio geothermicus DSM 3669 TaxID=1121426 RepID=A0A1I6DWP7_9FIRM|nr:hypothetical protein [Desulfoscipio geothermicus]SFR09708.1 hypothetical protein SAMN05660706_11935 [Desulfoscipio geothermicus DSM 3669]
MTLPNEHCPICEVQLNEENVARKDWLQDKPVRLDYAGRVLCEKCARWIDNTEWD